MAAIDLAMDGRRKIRKPYCLIFKPLSTTPQCAGFTRVPCLSDGMCVLCPFETVVPPSIINRKDFRDSFPFPIVKVARIL